MRDAAAIDRSLPGRRSWSASAGLVLLALIVTVGASPLAPVVSREMVLQAEGSAREAILYVLAAALCIVPAVPRLLRDPTRLFPLSIAFLFVLCWLSLLWSHVPGVAFTRLVQTTLVALSVFCAVGILGARRSLSLLFWTLAGLAVLDIVTPLLLSSARHPDGEWKGLHIHKNYAGPIAAATVFLSLARYAHTRRLSSLLVAAIAAVFLVGTQSRTSIYLVPVVLVCWATYGWLRSVLSKTGIHVVAMIVAVLIGVLFVIYQDALRVFLEDPKALTGRGELWKALLRYASDHLLSGSGFGSFWRLGDDSLILGLTQGWSLTTGQAHNGYLETLITLGLPGLLLALLTFLVVPFVRVIGFGPSMSLETSSAFLLVVFAGLHNLTESSLLVGGHPIYFLLSVAIAITHEVARTKRRTLIARRARPATVQAAYVAAE
jgi:O-antigen ligase